MTTSGAKPSLVDFAIAKMVRGRNTGKEGIRKTEMFLKTNKFRYSAMIEDVACEQNATLQTEQLAALADCSFNYADMRICDTR